MKVVDRSKVFDNILVVKKENLTNYDSRNNLV